MSQEVIEITEREIEIIEVVERGPLGPVGPQANINYTVVSSAQTLSNSQNIAADTSGGTFTLTLPLNPNEGDSIDIFDYAETFNTNPLLIARNGERIESLEEDLIANVQGAYFTMIYTGSTRGWQILPRYGTSGGGGESILTNQGDTLYRGPLVNERLPIGTAGQILKVNSTSTAPEWGEAPSTGVTSVTGTAPIASSGGTTPAISISAATTSAAGSMSSTDKTKLDGIASGAEVNVQSNWTEADTGSDAFILNKPSTFTPSAHGSTHHTGGTDAILPQNIGAQSVFTTQTITGATTLSSNRARIYNVQNETITPYEIILPLDPAIGDIAVFKESGLFFGADISIGVDQGGFIPLVEITAAGQQFTLIYDFATEFGWSIDRVDTHTHPSTAITDFNTAAAAAAPVQSVNGNTGTVTVAVPSASTATPSALGVAAAGTSNDFARADHVHAMPSASDVGAAADDDARLSDTRDPNAHAASHLPEGDDELFDQSLNKEDTVEFNEVISQGLSFAGGANFDLANGELRFDGNDIYAAGSGASLDVYVPITFAGDDAEANAATTLSNLGGAASGDIPDPSSATPQALGTAAAGTSDDYSRGDHIHAAPALNDLSNVSAATPSDNDVLVFDTATSTWVAEAPAGGGSGEVRSDFVSPYTYTGLAAAGTSESTASWTIRRSEFDAGGSFVATLTASAVQWANRLTASYA
jgi:hypothetical protein